MILGLVCTALAFVLFFALLAEIGPSRAPVITYVNPAVAILLGVLLLDEKVTTGMLVGFPLILIGSVLAARRRSGAVEPTGPEALVAETALGSVDPDGAAGGVEARRDQTPADLVTGRHPVDRDAVEGLPGGRA